MTQSSALPHVLSILSLPLQHVDEKDPTNYQTDRESRRSNQSSIFLPFCELTGKTLLVRRAASHSILHFQQYYWGTTKETWLFRAHATDRDLNHPKVRASSHIVSSHKPETTSDGKVIFAYYTNPPQYYYDTMKEAWLAGAHPTNRKKSQLQRFLHSASLCQHTPRRLFWRRYNLRIPSYTSDSATPAQRKKHGTPITVPTWSNRQRKQYPLDSSGYLVSSVSSGDFPEQHNYDSYKTLHINLDSGWETAIGQLYFYTTHGLTLIQFLSQE